MSVCEAGHDRTGAALRWLARQPAVTQRRIGHALKDLVDVLGLESATAAVRELVNAPDVTIAIYRAARASRAPLLTGQCIRALRELASG